MSSWRQVGLTYVNYSSIAARCVRNALKSEFRTEAAKRGETHVKLTKWEGGKPIKDVTGRGSESG